MASANIAAIGAEFTSEQGERLSAGKLAIWRSTQYAGLITPVYCWQRRDDDFVLVDFNDAANDLTMGYISALLGQQAGRIFAESPRSLADLRRCASERTTIQRRGRLRHPGLDLSIPGVAYYLFLPPNLVMVQVSPRLARGGANGRS